MPVPVPDDCFDWFFAKARVLLLMGEGPWEKGFGEDGEGEGMVFVRMWFGLCYDVYCMVVWIVCREG